MEIKIACETKLYLPLENIKDFQGALKTLDPDKKEKLKKQILEQGFAAPIFVWKNDGKYYCLDGTQRRVALQDLKSTGYKIPDLPCVEIHAKTKREAKKKLLSYVSQFGKVTGAGLYEFINEAELTVEELDDFEIPEIDLDDFKEEFFPEDKPVGDGSEDEIPEVAQNELGVELGDIYQLGEHRLMCGDSTDLATVEKLMNGEKADMVFTDPPYGMDVVKPDGNIGGNRVGKNGYGNKGQYGKEAKCGVYKPIIGDDKPFDPRFLLALAPIQIIWGANHFSDKLPTSPHWIVWNKEMPEGTDFSGAELAWTNVDKKAVKVYKFSWAGMTREGNRKEELVNRVHPTQKPVGLFSNILNDYDPKSVLDLFLGSGSTLIACEKTNRKCYGLELDPHYCSVIIKRWEEYTGKKHKKLT